MSVQSKKKRYTGKSKKQLEKETIVTHFCLTWTELLLYLLRSGQLILKLFLSCVCIDEEIPIIIDCPDHIWNNTEIGEETGIALWTPPTATDNSGIVTLTASHLPGESFAIGITKVTYTAVDPADNEADECCFNITIIGT